MKRFWIFLIVLTNYTGTYSQNDNTVFHPVVGDTINLKEKVDYLLFSEVSSKNFIYGIISFMDNEYKLISYHTNDTLTTSLDSAKIAEYRQNIDKLYAYYSNESKDSIIVNNKDNILLINNSQSPESINQNNLSPELRKQIGNDAQRYIDLNNAAENQGLSGIDKQNYIQSAGQGRIRLKGKK